MHCHATGKICHDTHRQAAAHLESLRRRVDVRKEGKRLCVYLCHECGCHHVGNSRTSSSYVRGKARRSLRWY
jgi:hypothetical protein